MQTEYTYIINTFIILKYISMAKVYTKRPDHWTDKDDNSASKQSKISEYQSGKVQKNIASTEALTQEELADGSRKIIKSAKVVKEGSDGKLEITEEAKTKFIQRSNTSSEKYFAKNHTEKVIDNDEDIEADTTSTTYKANSTTIDFKKFAETGNVGETQISSSKGISINSETISFSALK